MGPVRLGTVLRCLKIANYSFLASNLALPSCVVDDLVNISLPLENVLPVQFLQRANASLVGYQSVSTTLSQILGRTASYLTQQKISLFTLLHYFGELQEWSDELPVEFRRTTVGTPEQTKAISFLTLRYLDAVMIATRPFLASLARFGAGSLSPRLRNFFGFCANVASLAAREVVYCLRNEMDKQMVQGLTAFNRHFLVQSASILALSSVVQLGKRDERWRFRQCIELLLRIPGGRYGYLIRDMQVVDGKLERYAAMKAMKEPYALPLKKD